MKRFALAAILFSLAAPVFAANLVVDGGFESPITYDGPPFVGSWEGFNGGAGSSAANSTFYPRTGLQSLSLSIINTDNTFAGAFQDIPSLLAGDSYTFGGYHTLGPPTNAPAFGVGVEIRIEWRNSGSNTEISRTPNLTPVPGFGYSPFNLTGTVPAGADTARIVYAIQSFTPDPSNTGIVYVDDVSFTMVPEPSSAALLGLAGLGIAFIRSRRS